MDIPAGFPPSPPWGPHLAPHPAGPPLPPLPLTVYSRQARPCSKSSEECASPRRGTFQGAGGWNGEAKTMAFSKNRPWTAFQNPSSSEGWEALRSLTQGVFRICTLFEQGQARPCSKRVAHSRMCLALRVRTSRTAISSAASSMGVFGMETEAGAQAADEGEDDWDDEQGEECAGDEPADGDDGQR